MPAGTPIQRSVWIAATAVVCVAGQNAYAQAVDSGALQRQQQQLQTPPVQPPPAPAPEPSLQVPEAAAPSAVEPGQKLFVSGFKLSAPSPLISEAELSGLLSEFSGREDSFAEIDQAATRVSDALRKRGYAFVRVLVPQQEVTDNVVALEIVPGRLSKLPDGKADITITRTGKVRLHDERAKAIVAAALANPAGLTLPDVERGMLLLNSQPGVQATGVLVPGVEPNALGLALDLKEGPLFSGYLDLDNFGSRDTGPNRAVADLRINDPGGYGDQAELNVAKTTGTTSTTASYDAPLGVWGLHNHLSASLMQYRLLKEFSKLDAKGGSSWYSDALNYLQLRTQNASFSWSGTLDFKKLHDSSAGVTITSRRSLALTGGARGSYQFADNKRFLDYAITLTVGDLNRGGNANDRAIDKLTRHTQGIYEILRTNGSWLQQFSPRFSLSALGQAQLASRNLDSSEKLYVGGPRGVRAYPIEEAGSDSGEIVNLEARWAVVQTSRQDWTVFGLFDAGRAQLNQHEWANWNAGNPSLSNSYLLKGYGVGLRAHLGRWVQLELVGARRLGSNPGASAAGLDADGRRVVNRFWLVSSVAF